MPFVNVKMLEGRTIEQKKQLVKAITESMAEICGANPEYTMVVVEDIAKDHWARGGVMASDRIADNK
jgi:4-oxalocrotonate tautomerase